MTANDSGSNSNEIWLSQIEVIERIPSHPSKPTLWRWVRAGAFPKPQAGLKRLYWRESEINAWLASR
jgi:predicted DNA-binding transcriptional regulator AlpA